METSIVKVNKPHEGETALKGKGKNKLNPQTVLVSHAYVYKTHVLKLSLSEALWHFKLKYSEAY